MTVELIVLANSIKHNGCCVAGKTLEGEWIRVVADVNGKELTNERASIINPYGKFLVKPLQKVKINLTEHAPLHHQPENHVSDPNTPWIQNYNITLDQLNLYLDSPTDLWGSTHDKIAYIDIEQGRVKIDNSLYLIYVQKMKAYLNTHNKRRLLFNYNGLTYDLPVTSPNFDLIEKNKEVDDIILCISLGENYQGNCYKIVANIF